MLGVAQVLFLPSILTFMKRTLIFGVPYLLFIFIYFID